MRATGSAGFCVVSLSAPAVLPLSQIAPTKATVLRRPAALHNAPPPTPKSPDRKPEPAPIMRTPFLTCTTACVTNKSHAAASAGGVCVFEGNAAATPLAPEGAPVAPEEAAPAAAPESADDICWWWCFCARIHVRMSPFIGTVGATSTMKTPKIFCSVLALRAWVARAPRPAVSMPADAMTAAAGRSTWPEDAYPAA